MRPGSRPYLLSLILHLFHAPKSLRAACHEGLGDKGRWLRTARWVKPIWASSRDSLGSGPLRLGHLPMESIAFMLAAGKRKHVEGGKKKKGIQARSVLSNISNVRLLRAHIFFTTVSPALEM